MSKPERNTGFNWQHGAIILTGLAVFVLLLIAKKSNLDNDAEAGMSQSADTPAAPPVPPMMQPGGEEIADPGTLPPWRPEGELSAAAEDQVKTLESARNTADSVAAYKTLVEGFQQQGRFADAAWFAAKLAETQPEEAKNWLVAGALYRHLNLLPQAEEDEAAFSEHSDRALWYLSRARELDPANEDASLELALARLESPRPAQFQMQGVMILRELVDANPDNVEAQYNLGLASMESGQVDKAVDRFEKVLALRPTRHEARFQLAMAHRQLGDEDAFRQEMAKVAEQKELPALAQRARELLK